MDINRALPQPGPHGMVKEEWGLSLQPATVPVARPGQAPARRNPPSPTAAQDCRPLLQAIAKRTDVAVHAFTLLYLQYAKRLFRFCHLRLQDPEVAHEVTHEVFLTVWENAHTYQGYSSLDVWLFGIACNLCRTTRRHALRLIPSPPREATGHPQERTLNEVQRVPTTNQVSEVPSSAPDPAAQAAARQQWSLIRQSLQQLSAPHREVLHLTYFEGLSIRDIAQILGIPRGTVKSRMYMARRMLKHDLLASGLTQEDI